MAPSKKPPDVHRELLVGWRFQARAHGLARDALRLREPGRDIGLARRQGRGWSVGAMTGDEARTARVPLGFLPPAAGGAAVIPEPLP